MNHFPNINSITDMNKKLGVHTCRATLHYTQPQRTLHQCALGTCFIKQTGHRNFYRALLYVKA